MSPVMVSAGVYSRILDYSLYIPALSTTIMGMVGMASKGPLNEATYISNVSEFNRVFGSPNPNYMGPYAALQFLRYGRQMYYVRVAGPSAAYANVVVPEQTTYGTITSPIAGPFTIQSAANNVLRVKVNGGSFIVCTLTPGVRTAAQVVTDLTDALTVGGATNFETVITDGYLGLRSTVIGAGSSIQIDAVGNGSSANAVFGFPTAGITSTGLAATAGTIHGVGVNQPFQIITDSNHLLDVVVDGTTYNVALDDGAQSAADVAANIHTVINVDGHTADTELVSGNTVVRITSATTGVSSTVQVLTSSTAASTLGFDLALHKGSAATQALVMASKLGAFSLGANNLLKLRFNSGLVRDVAFPVGLQSASAIASAINIVVGPDGYNEGLASVTADNKLRIKTLVVGAAGSVQADSAGTGQYAMNMSTAVASGIGDPVNSPFSVRAASKGTYGNALRVVASDGQEAGTFKLTVYSGDSGPVVDAWDNLVKDNALSENYVTTKINDNSEWIYIVDNDTIFTQPMKGTVYSLAGGSDGLDTVADADYIGQNTPGLKTGMQIFANAEEIDLNLLAVPGISSAAVINEMLLICTIRQDTFCIIDPPLGLSVQQVVDWHNGAGSYSDHQAFNSYFGALYWPWTRIYDAVNRQSVWVPPSGLVSGVYAYTDYTTETWFAPAGLNRGHLIQPEKLETRSPDLGERDLMYGNQNAVNPIVKFPKDGITVWGQRTLSRKPSALDRVNVVRMILYLRKVISTAARYLVFEPNDPITWADLVNRVEPYLESVKARRGLYDFKVICDNTTNPPDAIDRNEMRAVIALKPVKAAEFIQLDFVVTNTGTKFEDLFF